MPTYLFENPSTGEIKEIIQGINEEHKYVDSDGLMWNRVYTVPQASIDTKIDPLSAKDFAAKTGSKKGTLGDMFDQAREASLKREAIIGKDPIKEDYEKKYSEKRGGRKRPKKISDVVVNI
jgi:hypothetical protein